MVRAPLAYEDAVAVTQAVESGRTGDGKRYWSNVHTGLSVWEEPRELADYRRQLAALQPTRTSSPRESHTPEPHGASRICST